MNISIAINTITRGLMAAGINGSSRAGVPTPSLDLDFINSETLDPRITFSRASNATRINSAGVLEYAPHNLLTYSEQFDNAAWTKTASTTVTANAGTAPDATTTADQLTSAGAGVFRSSIAVTQGVLHTASVYAKYVSGGSNFLFGFDAGPTSGRTTFNLQTGVVVSNDANVVSSSITPIGNGWYRCVVSAITTSTTCILVYYNVTVGSNWLIWGAQLNVGALQPYYPTTVKNLLGFSEAFENAAWTKSNSFIQTNFIRNNMMVGAVAGTPGTMPTNWFVFTSLTGLTREIVGTGTENGVTYVDIRLSGTPSASGDYQFFPEGVTATVAASGQSWNFSSYYKLQSGSLAGISDFQLSLQERDTVGNFLAGIFTTQTAPSSTTRRADITRTLNNASTTRVNPGYRIVLTGVAIDVTLRIGMPQLVQGATPGDVVSTYGTALPVMYKAPNGLMTADKLVESATTAWHYIGHSSVALTTIPYTMSVFAKAAERSVIQIVPDGGRFPASYANFNLSNGTVSASSGVDSSSIVALGDGWYRCSLSVTATSAGTTTPFYVSIQTSPTAARAGSYAGDGTSGIYIGGAQLSDSASLDTYVNNPGAAPTAAAYYGPRFNYDPVTLAPQGLLIEEQRTNSIRNNTGVGAVAGTPGTLPTNWSRSSYAGMSIDVVGTGTESGITYIDCRFVGTAGASSHSLNLDAVGGIAAVTGQTWTLSSFVRIVSGSTSGITAFRIVTAEFTSGGAFVTSNVTAITPTTSALITQRLSATQTLSGGATTASVVPSLNLTYTNGAAIDITLRIGLPQLELGAFATSAIPTTTAAATRSADVATITGSNFSGFYNQNEGTLFGEVAYFGNLIGSPVATNHISINNGTADNTINLRTVRDTSNSQADVRIRANGTTYMDTAGLQPVVANTFYKRAMYYSSTSARHCVNGSFDGTATANPIIPVVNQLTIPANGTEILAAMYIKKLAYYPTRLSDQQLQNITS